MALLFQVKILAQNENSRLQAALVSNLKSAVTAAFLMLPESFSEEDLYLQIAGLSYSGECGGSEVAEKSCSWSTAGVSRVINRLPSCFGPALLHAPRILSEWWLHNISSNWVYSQEIGVATPAVLPVPAWFMSS